MTIHAPERVARRTPPRAAHPVAMPIAPHHPDRDRNDLQHDSHQSRRPRTQAGRVYRAARAHRVHNERGAAAVWTMIIVTTAFVGLMGLVGGGGELINERVEAKRAAEQAARAGADALSVSAVRSGSDQVDAGEAIARATSILTQAGWSGSVQVQGSRVVVTATGSRKPHFLSLIGVGAIEISETGAAQAISTPNG